MPQQTTADDDAAYIHQDTFTRGADDQGSASATGGQNPDDDRERKLRLSGEEAFLARARLSRGGSSSTAPAAAPSTSGFAPPGIQGFGGIGFGGSGPQDDYGAPKGMTLAQKMLEKMGWKEGDGLGRNRQGISTPLVMQKTDKHTAVIVNAPGPPEKRAKVGATFTGTPTKIVVLRNMVGPGEVDDDLEEEVSHADVMVMSC